MVRNQRGSSIISVVVAILAIGLFFGWLATREQPEQVVVAEPGDTASENATDEPVVLEADQMSHSARLDELTGQLVRMEGQTVVGSVGPQMFWIELSSGDLYLVRLSDMMIGQGAQPPTSGEFDIEGYVREKNEATLDEWMESGVLQSEADRTQAEFGLSYLEAVRVEPAGN